MAELAGCYKSYVEPSLMIKYDGTNIIHYHKNLRHNEMNMKSVPIPSEIFQLLLDYRAFVRAAEGECDDAPQPG